LYNTSKIRYFNSDAIISDIAADRSKLRVCLPREKSRKNGKSKFLTNLLLMLLKLSTLTAKFYYTIFILAVVL
jgi:hypothetical protein